MRSKIDPQFDADVVAEEISKISDVRGILKTLGFYNLTIFTTIKNVDHLFALETEFSKITGIREIEPPLLFDDPIIPSPRDHMSTF